MNDDLNDFELLGVTVHDLIDEFGVGEIMIEKIDENDSFIFAVSSKSLNEKALEQLVFEINPAFYQTNVFQFEDQFECRLLIDLYN